MDRLSKFKIYFIIEHAAYERVFEPLCSVKYPYPVKIVRLYKYKNRFRKFIKRFFISSSPNALIVCCTAGRFFKPYGGYRIQIFHAPASFGGSWNERYLKYFDVICPVTYFQLDQVSNYSQGKIVHPVGLPYLDRHLSEPTNITSLKYDLCYAPTYHQDISSIFYFLEPLIEYCEIRNKTLLLRPHPLLLETDNIKYSGGIDWHLKLLELSKGKFIFYDETDDISEVLMSSAVITDTSGLAYEFASITGRPVGFVGNKLKLPFKSSVDNITVDINHLPEVAFRNSIGPLLENDFTANSIHQFITDLFDRKYDEARRIKLEKYIFNLGFASAAFQKLIRNITKDSRC